MAIPQAVLEQVSNKLQGYVYMLVDPESGVPFYVGKGHGLRHAAHVAEALVPVEEDGVERSRKLRRIAELIDADREGTPNLPWRGFETTGLLRRSWLHHGLPCPRLNDPRLRRCHHGVFPHPELMPTPNLKCARVGD